MNTLENNNDLINLNNKFGYITENQLVITKGSKHNKIHIDSIKRVNLFKNRLLLNNLLCFMMSSAILIYVFLYLRSNKNILFYSMIVVGIALFFYSFIHKFYVYKLVIKENNNRIVEIKTTQINRNQIKDFYECILMRIPKK